MSRHVALVLPFASALLLAACAPPVTGTTTPVASGATAPSTSASSAASSATPVAAGAPAAPTPVSDPELGKTTFFVYESFMSPPQQPGDESEAPKLLVKATGFQATEPSLPRDQRKSLGYGRIRFNKNLSAAYVDVAIEGINPQDIVMFHVHCGPPGVLGPILVNFGEFGDLTKILANGKMSVELSNKNITYVKDMPGLKPALPESCPVEPGWPTQAMTIADMNWLARKGVLYFNLHTKANTFYGEVRGQIFPVKEP